jgi:hypothetical protein
MRGEVERSIFLIPVPVNFCCFLENFFVLNKRAYVGAAVPETCVFFHVYVSPFFFNFNADPHRHQVQTEIQHRSQVSSSITDRLQSPKKMSSGAFNKRHVVDLDPENALHMNFPNLTWRVRPMGHPLAASCAIPRHSRSTSPGPTNLPTQSN